MQFLSLLGWWTSFHSATAAYNSTANGGCRFSPGWSLTTPWNFTAPWKEIIANQDLMTNVLIPKLAVLTPNGSCYLNEGDFKQPDSQSVFYGSNYQKLNEIKKKHVPYQTFYATTAIGSGYWVPQPDGRLCVSN